MSFGKKGLAAGETAPAMGGGFGRAAPAGSGAGNADEIAAKREAFLASERERKAAELGIGGLPDAGAGYSDNPMASLHNSARPAQPIHAGPGGGAGMSAAQEAEIRAAARGMARNETPMQPGYSGGGTSSGFVFGDPATRSVGLAYVLWFVLGQLSVHRFYCGQKDTAFIQMGLWIGSLVILFIFPPIGFVGLLVWICWLFGDLFMIPGMLRKFKAEHDYRGVFA